MIVGAEGPQGGVFDLALVQIRGRVSLVFLLLVCLTLAACASHESPSPNSGFGGGIFSSLFGDLDARQPRSGARPPGGPAVAAPGPKSGIDVVYADSSGGGGGTGTGSGDGTGTSSTPSGKPEYRLNFDNADLPGVVKAILGDALGLNYTIDPAVAGKVTLSSARPVARQDLLRILETLLQMNGAVLNHEGELYRVSVDNGASMAATDRGSADAGYGLSVLPLKFVSAKTLTALIDGFGVRSGIVRVDASRNLLLVLGNSADRKSAIDTALSFDTDWMKNQAVAIVSLSDSVPESIIPQLERIFDTGEGGAGADLIQFTPMSRLKAVLVVAKRRELLDRARTWIKRLDLRNTDIEAGVYVYRVKYGDAKNLSDILTRVFSESALAETTPTNQVEPGAGTTVQTTTTDQTTPAPGEAPASPAPGTESPAATPPPSQPETQPTNQAGGAGSKIRISPDTVNNSIVIYADSDTQRKILAALHQIDVPSMQVAINVTMAEIKLTNELSNGVQYFLKSGSLGLGSDVGSIGLFGDAANSISRVVPGFNFVIGSEKNPDVIISAFQKLTDVRILSSPSLVVLDNQTAKLQVGDTIPVTTRQAQSVTDSTAPIVNSIDYVDTGIILNVKPRVADNGVVQMVIDQEISSVTSASTSLTPTISKRKVSSTISVNDGQTVLLGGLISQQSNFDHGGIPGVFKMKGIGEWFGQKSNTGNRNELIILIQPTIIRQGIDAQRVAETLRSKMRALNGLARDP